MGFLFPRKKTMSKTVKAAVKPQDSRMVLIIEPKTESRAPSQYALISYNNATAVDVVSNPSGTGATSQTTINETIKNSQEFVAESVKMKLSKDQKHKKAGVFQPFGFVS